MLVLPSNKVVKARLTLKPVLAEVS